jgi:hypothetical protein
MTFTIGFIVGMVSLLTVDRIAQRRQLHAYICNQAMLARMERIARSGVITGYPGRHSEKAISSLRQRAISSLQQRVRGNERSRTDQHFAA